MIIVSTWRLQNLHLGLQSFDMRFPTALHLNLSALPVEANAKYLKPMGG